MPCNPRFDYYRNRSTNHTVSSFISEEMSLSLEVSLKTRSNIANKLKSREVESGVVSEYF